MVQRAFMLAAVLILSFFCFTPSSDAKQPAEVVQIGWLSPVVPKNYDPSIDPLQKAFKEGLQGAGYVEGKNLHVEYRFPHKSQEVAEMAADLVSRNLQVIATTGPEPIEALSHATHNIPIVIIACDRADRLIANIARPGGNITGMACISSDLAAKRLQFLQELVPAISRIAILYNSGVPAKVSELADVQAAAKMLEIDLQPVEVRDADGFRAAFTTIEGGDAQGLIILVDPLTFFNVPRIADFTIRRRLPAIYGFREFCAAGGLISYGTNLVDLFRRYGYFIDRILKGTKAGDMPIEDPTTFELVVNARTAKAFGLTVPPSILTLANEVIE
jgi:putative tryptophan/tyrosine transport system substrate-binding protein